MALFHTEKRLVLLTYPLLLFVASTATAQQTIILGDDTPKDEIVAENVLGDAMSMTSAGSDGTMTYVLLKSPVSSYFRVDEHTGRLETRRPIDRDRLCADSGLCCVQNRQNSVLSSIRPSDNGELGTVCSLLLNVAVTASHRRDSVPTTRKVFIEIKDENDNPPVFFIPNHASSQYVDSPKTYGSSSSTQTPLLILNISEAARVGAHRLALPLATDLDAPPFNVQRYVLKPSNGQHFASSSSASSPERYFKLETQKRRLNSLSHFEAEGPIMGLDLLLVAPLDRETRPLFEFRVLAIDGGSPTPLTGTLSVQIRVLDANDHDPRFEAATYETRIEEGHVMENVPILTVVAHDEDEGVNARIRYSWWPDFERFGPHAKLLLDHRRLLTDEEVAATFGSSISPELLSQLQALPTYWFRLNEWTGEIFVHRPLDYETRRRFVFAIVATNPDVDNADGSGGITAGKFLKNSPSMTKVTINVINLNDEKPQINIDYVVNSESVKHKKVMENGPPDHFIALIRASDADAGAGKLGTALDDAYMVQTSSFQFGGSGEDVRLNRPRLSHSIAGGHVTCDLGSHSENYTLTPAAQTDITAGVVEYVLKTKTPLDRELEQRQFVIIRCYDDGSPPKTATATVEVEIQDQNDCVPEINVHARVHQSNVISPIPRIRLADILRKAFPDWPNAHRSPFVEHPLVNAFEAGVPVVPVSVPENRPAGTVVASLRGVDPDGGENGRVTFEILKEDQRLPRIAPGPPTSGQRVGRYPEGKIDHNLPPLVVRSDPNSVDLFKLEANGDITTSRVIDREQSPPLGDELYLFVKAQDWGHPVALTSYVLLAVEIEDENDNLPKFDQPQITFPVLENQTAPQRVGEIVVRDSDSDASREGYHDVLQDSLLPPAPRVTEPPKHAISLIIGPGHGVPDLPFVIVSTPDGHFFLNVTRPLDREVEEIFHFQVQAMDSGGPAHLRHTSTATITVSVVDVNDNAPEIIFPKPATATAYVHTLSYLEMPDTEILSVNANDRDPEGDNGKFLFELGRGISSCPGVDASRLAKTGFDEDLFKLDAVKGLLMTKRRMTEADLGEHCLQLIVRDLGTPPQETRQVIRLAVDRSPPQFASSIRARMPPHQRTSPLTDYPGNNVVGPLYRHTGEWNNSGRSISDVVMAVIISLMIAGLIVLIGLCFYLRHRQKLFFCLPDVCTLFQKTRPSSTPYTGPECVGDSGKMNASRKTAREGNSHSRAWTPLPPPPLSGREFVVSSSKCLPSVGGVFASPVNGTPRCQVDAPKSTVPDASDFFERSPKLYTDCYHVGISGNPAAPQSSRLVPIPAGTFKPIISPKDEFSAPKSNFYNSATMGVQPTVLSPIHRPDLITSSGRYGETLPLPSLYVQSNGPINPHHRQTLAPAANVDAVSPTMIRYSDGLQPHQQKAKMVSTQGSCDLLAFSNSFGHTRFVNRSAHYKSEPALAAGDALDEDDDDHEVDDGVPESLVCMSNGAHSEDYLGDAALGSRDRFPSVVPSDRKARTALTTQRQQQQQPLENYAVSFPKPQASYV